MVEPTVARAERAELFAHLDEIWPEILAEGICGGGIAAGRFPANSNGGIA